MVLLAPSIGASRKLVNACERYANAYKLRYNLTKRVTVFKSGRHSVSILANVGF